VAAPALKLSKAPAGPQRLDVDAIEFELLVAHTKLNEAYEAAKAILRRAPNEPEIFEEGQIDDLVAKIEDDIRAHHAL
jgi:hypothetical protein